MDQDDFNKKLAGHDVAVSAAKCTNWRSNDMLSTNWRSIAHAEHKSISACCKMQDMQICSVGKKGSERLRRQLRSDLCSCLRIVGCMCCSPPPRASSIIPAFAGFPSC